MRRLIVWNLVTLDGHFEGRNPWEIDWHEYAWGDELKQFSIEQSREIGTLLFGRATYQGMAAHWPSAEGEVAAFMNAVPKVVFSNTLEGADWNNTRLVRGSAEDEVAKLKRQEGKDLFIFGSAKLCSTLLAAGLIDEVRLGLTPVVLGGGTPLFKPQPKRLRMQLLEAKILESGCVILCYAPDFTPAPRP